MSPVTHTPVMQLDRAISVPRTVVEAPVALHRKTVTLLFSDIVGSTPVMAALGDMRWMDILHAHDAIWSEQAGAHRGRLVKHRGDGFMIAFPSARDAILCAIATQRALNSRRVLNEAPIQVRIGIHTGDVIVEAQDYYGRQVNVAARISDRADAGEILVSDIVRELVASRDEFEFGDCLSASLKGLDGRFTLHPVRW